MKNCEFELKKYFEESKKVAEEDMKIELNSKNFLLFIKSIERLEDAKTCLRFSELYLACFPKDDYIIKLKIRLLKILGNFTELTEFLDHLLAEGVSL